MKENGEVAPPGETEWCNPTPYCRPCEAFTSDNDAMVEAGSEFPAGGKRKWGRKPTKNEPVAQSVEHVTFNHGVGSSSLPWLTIYLFSSVGRAGHS